MSDRNRNTADLSANRMPDSSAISCADSDAIHTSDRHDRLQNGAGPECLDWTLRVAADLPMIEVLYWLSLAGCILVVGTLAGPIVALLIAIFIVLVTKPISH